MSNLNLPLPDGWIQQHDSRYDRPFWVDTRAKPPRAIWVHPFEDEQFLNEHPEEREKRRESNLGAPPPYDAVVGTFASGSDGRYRDATDADSERSSHVEHKRGVFGKLKDKAIGTKEEREEQRRQRAARAALEQDLARQERMRELEEREVYMRAHGGYAPYHPGPGYNANANGLANPTALLLGGLAGGLLLGDIFSGGF